MAYTNGKHDTFFSIIIPCRKVDAYVKRCVQQCSKLPERHEIIVVPDSLCPGYPAIKRNWAMKRASGNVYAFIDSDAYPSTAWLRTATYYLNFHAAVCGPGILPPEATLEERVSDWVFKHLPYSYRVHPGRPGWVSEYPTFNLIVRKEYAPEFENYLTGEDSLFCRKIGGAYYHPSILVFHHRREIFKPLWRQVATYGRHRGNFIKLAILAWITATFVYATNFIKGLFIRRPS